ncbi:MAG: polysaccharide deacetylase family protein [Ruminococcus sp.]|nr:polysaccharide deacetylase family protein [Ruminococcus sp.]
MQKMLFPNGLKKAFTTSYDDGCYDDIRLMEMMDEYGIKGTFNISSQIYREEGTKPYGVWPRVTLTEALEEYPKHGVEVAVHGLHHRDFTKITEPELYCEIATDKANLEMQYGGVVRGAAYPYGSFNNKAVEALRKCGIKYCRTVCTRDDFGMPEDWLRLFATCHHGDKRLPELLDRFLTTDFDDCRMFYLWGHTAEFRRDNNWDVIENVFKKVSGNPDIWFATNIEICEYHKAYQALEYSTDPRSHAVYNPTAKDIWIEVDGKAVVVPSGATVNA